MRRGLAVSIAQVRRYRDRILARQGQGRWYPRSRCETCDRARVLWGHPAA